jgi:hypothetical protein
MKQGRLRAPFFIGAKGGTRTRTGVTRWNLNPVRLPVPPLSRPWANSSNPARAARPCDGAYTLPDEVALADLAAIRARNRHPQYDVLWINRDLCGSSPIMMPVPAATDFAAGA